MTACISRGSTPSRSPARKMIKSRSRSPDCGISSGMKSSATAACIVGGARDRTERKPSNVSRKEKKENCKRRELGSPQVRHLGKLHFGILHVSDDPGGHL